MKKENWKSQIVTSNLSEREIAGLRMGLRRAPYAFTERGLYMLATVLNSKRAVRAIDSPVGEVASAGAFLYNAARGN